MPLSHKGTKDCLSICSRFLFLGCRFSKFATGTGNRNRQFIRKTFRHPKDPEASYFGSAVTDAAGSKDAGRSGSFKKSSLHYASCFLFLV